MECRVSERVPDILEIPEAPLLRHIYSPITLNRLVLPNRVLMSSVPMNLDNFPDQYERMANFYAIRAKEEVGLILTAGCALDRISKISPNSFALECDAQISLHRRITDAVHHEKGRIALQILHNGLVSSSGERLPSNLFATHVLTDEEIGDTIASFTDCAGRAMRSGYDAIELVFSQGFLVHQFLTPACNKRSDQWGGSFDNRMRLAVEVASAVRDRVGPDYPLIFRIPCMDLIEDGLTQEESMALIGKIMPFGIDLLNIGVGWHESEIPTIATTIPLSAFINAARNVRNRFPILKIGLGGRINDLRAGEKLLIDGYADVFWMGRPFLADPALVSKGRTNAFDRINTCIACNQSCLDYAFLGQAVGCSVNPDCALPQESQYPPFSRPLSSLFPEPLRVAVVGGGIAGMGAALFFARRGARVTLYEQESILGGQLRLAARIPDKEVLSETIRYYAAALCHEGVEIRLGCRFDSAIARSEAWDHVVLAQGGIPRQLESIPGIKRPHVLNYIDVLERECPVAFPAVVIGGGGVACDIAKYLIKRNDERYRIDRHSFAAYSAGNSADYYYYPDPYDDVDDAARPEITLLQHSGRQFAHRVGGTTRWAVLQSLKQAGVVMRNRIDVLEVTPDAVVIFDRARGRQEHLPARTVILAAGQEARPAPMDALDALNVRYSVMGAAVGTGNRANPAGTNLTSALREAYRLAMEFA